MPGKKLLVADDSLTIQKVIRLALSNEGYEIQAVSDGNDAVQQISLFRPDVVLIDVSLPGKSAFEVKRETNQHDDLEEVRFVLMSSAFESVDEAQSQEVTFHGNLTKPFDPAHLRQVLTDVLAQVTAKRMEKTSILRSPSTESIPPIPSIPSLPRPPEDLSVFPPPPLEDSKTEEWIEPVKPEEMPLFPPTHPEPIQDLWETIQDSSNIPDPDLPSPPSLPQSPHLPFKGPTLPSDFESPGDDSDIKRLADSTLRISGLDDFQWSVNEPSIKEPSIKPPRGMMDRGNSTFHLGSEGAEDSSLPPPYRHEHHEPSGLINPSTFPPDMGGLADMMESSEAEERTPGPPDNPPQMNLQHTHYGTPPSREPAISQEQIQMLVEQHIVDALEKMAHKLLPELAEKIIKQEIHRMLSE